ncbi:MAG TPA: nuclease-related domain-containing protein [Leifsonia sp.]|nr:hypothetical protein [Microbacteriaceae bacterium]HEV7812245.1 nuclease-related domain-containing protein [Leifsonia sp.]
MNVRSSLRSRVAAETAMSNLLLARASMPRRSGFARAFGVGVLSDEGRHWYTAALSEIAVGDALAALGADWVVLHAVPLDDHGTGIDHVVIGPTGVFALSSGNHSDQFPDRSDPAGLVRRHIRNSELKVGRVERALAGALGTAVEATGVLIVVNPKSIPARVAPRDIKVIGSHELVDWLESGARVLSVSDVQQLADLAEKPETWLSSPLTIRDGERVRTEFDAVQREVHAARILRQAWSAGAASVLVVVVCLAAWVVATVTA